MNERYTIPSKLSGFSNLPLYMVVAIWGKRNKQLLTTKDVARAFSLTQQQATDVINYIYREGTKYIKSEKTTIFCIINGVKTKLRALKILDVVIIPLPTESNRLKQQRISEQKSRSSVKRNSPEKKDELRVIRQWMCHRRTGETYSKMKNTV
ncbi:MULTISPECIES: CaiF/GrlA family transcriptional regulator [Escherichia]|nr:MULTISPECIES: CaiF/GrlA family transcriptional regulator [Escherichia]MBB2284334.1 CaiF/GrlA family transcriptional regulator [Escherichia coli]MBB2412582.1 CaiF/GrlA family transcriptional regulator [Escherichia sp. 14.0985]MBB2430883.1 CaiF/GrlA family transcriptional regulator [Escherichia sp. 12.2612]MBB2453904.1 CaiF/GrlA family transcriptional regulator [Escherichia sp. 8.2195]MBB8471373.1 CaiF/GrlA family transcriptional regulator [Escherichia coli]